MILQSSNSSYLIRILTFLIFIFCLNSLYAAEGGPCKDYGCHSLQYSRWGRVANDLQIPEEIFFENLVFDKSIKPGDLMTGAMSEDSVNWFGVAPPDLTLVSRYKGDDWIYSYLRAYYEDASKQYGVNNLVYPGTAMPNVLLSLQGNQRLVCKNIPVIAKNGGEKRDEFGSTITKEKCGFLEVEEGTGELTKEEFDTLIYDLTNFLVYVGEPIKATRERIGWYVVFYFLIFTAEIKESKQEETPDEILSISPYHKLPILVDRDLAIHDPTVMMEYLDERFPHPPLLPVYPVARANCRTLMLRIDKEWCPMVDSLIEKKLTEKKLIKVREDLLHEIASIASTFKEFKFFMSDEFSLVDCCFGPILWRLPSLGINLPVNRHLKPLLDYQKTIFERPGFLDSLSSLERDLRQE